jgi:hypothetical protein
MLISEPLIIVPVILMMVIIMLTILLSDNPYEKLKNIFYGIILITIGYTSHILIHNQLDNKKCKLTGIVACTSTDNGRSATVEIIDPETKCLIIKKFDHRNLAIGHKVMIFYDVKNKGDQYITWSQNTFAYGNVKIHLYKKEK